MPDFQERKEYFEKVIKELNEYAIIYLEGNFKNKEDKTTAFKSKPEIYWKQWHEQIFSLNKNATYLYYYSIEHVTSSSAVQINCDKNISTEETYEFHRVNDLCK
ncbi:hypothetical protein RCL_jg21194.t1 [Rhizophagus clarus]|uniref:Uncharacterized protein n=1 Tax=Rhizophagus clarus TaxID=94130 RepID=A0A8H3QVX3_9GLOM|nr:hypothetical protein RCL_jg21194.t1 [Rhizophagus clarus]